MKAERQEEHRNHVPEPAQQRGASREPVAKNRFERGGKVYATDGFVGSLCHVVLNEKNGEVTAVGVAPKLGDTAVFLPTSVVDRTVGAAVFLTMTKAQFAAGAERAPRYDRKRYTNANPRKIPAVRRGPGGRQEVTRIRKDVVEVVDRASSDESETKTGDRPKARRATLFGGLFKSRGRNADRLIAGN